MPKPKKLAKAQKNKSRPSLLGKGAIKAIHSALDSLFDKIKARFLGPKSLGGKQIRFTYERPLSIPGLYESGLIADGAKPNLDTLDSLVHVAGGYVDSLRENSKANVVHTIQSFIRDAHQRDIQTDFRTILGGQLADLWQKTSSKLETIVNTEATKVRNVSALEGILEINASKGIEDAVVYWIVVKDGALCGECRRLHLMGDGHTPRLWYMSEVNQGYHKRGNNSPAIAGPHPRCRCSMVTLLPGYGFDAAGKVEFKKFGYMAIDVQRGTNKAEDMFPGLLLSKDEHKHEDNLNKALPPYNPATDTSDKERQTISDWQNYADTKSRNAIPRLTGAGRERALHKLHGKTEARRNPTTGEREFLLHRGVGNTDKLQINNGVVSHKGMGSWTFDPEIAQSFGKRRKGTVSAWIPESAIHHVLDQVGYVNDAATARVHGNQPKPGISVPHPTDPNAVPRAIGKPGYREGEILVKLPKGAQVHKWEPAQTQKTEPELSEEPLAKMAVLHDDPKNPRIVYRFEDDEGNGPYRKKDGSFKFNPNVPRNQPVPTSDFFPKELDEGGLGGKGIFGFAKPEDAVEWFGADKASKLHSGKMKLRAIPASRVWISSTGRQVMFHPHESAQRPFPVHDFEPDESEGWKPTRTAEEETRYNSASERNTVIQPESRPSTAKTGLVPDLVIEQPPMSEEELNRLAALPRVNVNPKLPRTRKKR